MRFTYASFTGYIGFYNGMGIENLTIDFRKCRNNIVVIHGMNGCGKTTLLSALSLFPDPNSAYMNGRYAEKVLQVVSGADIYDIKIVSEVDNKGQRKQTKAYIAKNFVQLNSNGNITSYKEIVFSEFDLDPNYISLSKLSSDDKGLGSKTPAERKRFVSSIIESLDIYNNIYKTLNKRSLIFKSHINTLHTKIQNIGMKDLLETNLRAFQMDYTNIATRIEELNTKIISIQAKSSIDSEEETYISETNNKYSSLLAEMDAIDADMSVLLNKLKIKKENIFTEYAKVKENIETHKNRVSTISSSWVESTRRLSELQKSINESEADFDVLCSEIDNGIDLIYTATEGHVRELKKQIKKTLNCTDEDYNIDMFMLFNMITVFEKTQVVYSRFIEMIDVFYENVSTEDLEQATNPKLFELRENNAHSLASSIKKKQELEEEREELIKDHEMLKLIEKKPSNCKIKTCTFLAEAYKVEEKYKNQSTSLTDALTYNTTNYGNCTKAIAYFGELVDKYNYWIELRKQIDEILDYFFSNITQISPLFDPFGFDREKMIQAIANHNSFNDYRDPKNLIDHLNNLRTLKAEMSKLEGLSVDYARNNERVKHLEYTQTLLEKNKAEANKLVEEISSKKNEMDVFGSVIKSLEPVFENLTALSTLYTTYLQKAKESQRYKEKLDEINERHSRAMEAFKSIAGLKEELEMNKQKLIPINSEIQRISGQLTMLESYYKDYYEYKERYDIIEVLKKYCSPTGGGIQTVFMQLYLAKTLELSNQILQMLFGGEYKLLDFIINQNEFRIPFVGSGLPVDDISSGSRSQVSIMGMIINLVLYHQASTKFNIARLDEVDDSLDGKNRLEFINVLRNILPILGIEQLFCISHSIEADTSSVDIIKLKTYADSNINLMGNVIFDYEDIVTWKPETSN